MIQENKRCVRKLIELLWNQGALSVAKLLLDKNFVYYASLPKEPLDAEAFLNYVRKVRESMADVGVTIEEMVAEGDTVMVQSSFWGVLAKPLFGFAPSDRVVTLPAVSVYHMRHGRVKDLMTIYDVQAIHRQLQALSGASGMQEPPSQ